MKMGPSHESLSSSPDGNKNNLTHLSPIASIEGYPFVLCCMNPRSHCDLDIRRPMKTHVHRYGADGGLELVHLTYR